MSSKEVLIKWIEAFNKTDIGTLGDLYADTAINHQVVNVPVVGKAAIINMFRSEFSKYNMVRIPENIF